MNWKCTTDMIFDVTTSIAFPLKTGAIEECPLSTLKPRLRLESSHTNNRNQEVRSRLILFIYNRNNQFENVAEKTISLYCSTKFYKLARAKSDQVMY